MSAMNPRTLKLGQLEELKQTEYKLRVQIHASVSAMLDTFEPIDRDLRYIDAIQPKKLRILVTDIERKCHELSGVLRDKADIEKELGE